MVGSSGGGTPAQLCNDITKLCSDTNLGRAQIGLKTMVRGSVVWSYLHVHDDAMMGHSSFSSKKKYVCPQISHLPYFCQRVGILKYKCKCTITKLVCMTEGR